MQTHDFRIDWRSFKAELKKAVERGDREHYFAYRQGTHTRNWQPFGQVLQNFLSWAVHHGCAHVYGDYCVLVFPIKHIKREKTDGE